MAEHPASSMTPWQELKTDAAACRWLRWHPSQLASCVAERGDFLPEPLGADELRELREAHAKWGADPASLAAIDLLGSPRTRVVIAGQQPGFLAGPLLIVYKAMAAVKLARRLAEQNPGLDFAPVFWVASEDHDFNEIRRAYWPGQSGLEEAYIQPSLWEAGQMIGLVETESVIGGLVGQIEQTTFRSEYRDTIIKLLREAYGAADATVESGFCRLLLKLLAGTGLVVVSPLMNWVRRRGAAIMTRELEQAGRSTVAVIARAVEMGAAGMEPPVHRAPTAINGFWVDGQGRRWALHRGEDGRVRRVLGETREELEPVAVGELLGALAADAARVSPNVVTRAIVQDAILPTVAQVVGPGEAAYLAQIEPAYENFGVFAPVRWPRPELTLIEQRVARSLEKYEIELGEALCKDPEPLMERFLRGEMEHGALSRIETLRARQRGEIEELYGGIGLDVPAIRAAFDKLAQAMDKGYKAIEERVLQQRAEDEAHVRRGLAIVSASLRPAGLAQERALNPIIPFAVNYGLDWVGRLFDKIDITPTRPLQVVALAELVKGETHARRFEPDQAEGDLQRLEQG
ncbi:MAG: bacillithiol biosynthesis cysteine-adding enzyme BshC [Candidatus Sumerlaeia bacterium]